MLEMAARVLTEWVSAREALLSVLLDAERGHFGREDACRRCSSQDLGPARSQYERENVPRADRVDGDEPRRKRRREEDGEMVRRGLAGAVCAHESHVSGYTKRLA